MEPGSNFNQFNLTDRAGWMGLLLRTVVAFFLHGFRYGKIVARIVTDLGVAVQISAKRLRMRLLPFL